MSQRAFATDPPTLQQIALARGPVSGVTFDSAHNRFFVEQIILDSSQELTRHRLILSYSLSTFSKTDEQVVESKHGRPMFLPTCNDISADASGSFVLVCLDDHIIVLRSQDLTPIRSFPLPENRVALSMAVDDKRSEVIVLLGPTRQDQKVLAHNDLFVATYDWSTGTQKSVGIVGAANFIGTAKLLFDHNTGTVMVIRANYGSGESSTSLYTCSHEETMVCGANKELKLMDSITAINATVMLNPHSHQGEPHCILQMDLNSGAEWEHYCGAAHALKGPIAVSNGRAVLAFTGSSRYNPFTEHTTNVQSSVALWCSEEMRRPLSITLPFNERISQGSVKIVGDAHAAYFAVFTGEDDSVLAVVNAGSCSLPSESTVNR